MPSHPSRHIQDFTDADNVEPHWGYADRVVPCVNDRGSCEYLDEVYASHDLGMILAGVLWLTLVTVFAAWGLARLGSKRSALGLHRACRAAAAVGRRALLPESLRLVFGRTTRYQIAALGLLSAYLAVFSFVGMSYRTWVTPVADSPGVFNTRTTLGPFADRVGIFAYALTPLSILLAGRESVLTLVTGMPYQSFNFLHRWTGYLILVQSVVHTVGWTVVETRLYQPQPEVGAHWIRQGYMVWGCVAVALLVLLWVLSLAPVVGATGYEFFRKSHYVLAMVYCGACIAHWDKLTCFLIPAMLFWGIDRLARAVRTALIHRGALDGAAGTFFRPARAAVTLYGNEVDGDVVRLDFSHPHGPWRVGEHFYLCFPEGSIWQSHPFTPLSLPEIVHGAATHSYVFRAKSGETRTIARLAAAKRTTASSGNADAPAISTSVILTGPYGEDVLSPLTPAENVLCVAGGTGIAYVLPVLLALARAEKKTRSGRKIDLVWIVRCRGDVDWVRPELDVLRAAADAIAVRIYVTRESGLSLPADNNRSSPTSAATDKSDPTITAATRHASSFSVHAVGSGDCPKHPDVGALVEKFVDDTAADRTTVFASGPGGMMTDLRAAVARRNDVGNVWQGRERFDVSLRCDDRMER